MSTHTVSPPEELPVGRGVYPCLVLPFDEPASRLHDQHPGRVYTWADVRMPRKQVDVRDGHDGEVVGMATHWIKDRTALWCAIKLGRRGEEILRRGLGVSAEILDGEVTHVALAGSLMPGFASAGVYARAGAVLVPDAPLGFGVDLASGLVAFRPPMPAPTPAPSLPAVVNLSEASRLLAGVAGPDPELEVARARALYQDRLESLAESRTDWEQVARANAARGLAELERQQAAEAVADDGEIAARDFAERMERLQAAAARVRPWWRGWFQ